MARLKTRAPSELIFSLFALIIFVIGQRTCMWRIKC